MSDRLRGVAVAIALLGLLAACTSPLVSEPISTASIAPTTSVSIKLPETTITTKITSVSASTSISTSTSTELTTESTDPSVSNPWPAEFTPEQAAMARSALEAFTGYASIANAAQQDPAAKDWTADVRRYTADPEAELFLQSLKSMVQAKVHINGQVVYEGAAVSSIDGVSVIVMSCLDVSGQQAVTESGESAVPANPNPRTLSRAAVTDYGAANGGWLIWEVRSLDPVTPC